MYFGAVKHTADTPAPEEAKGEVSSFPTRNCFHLVSNPCLLFLETSLEPRFGDKNLVSKGVWRKKRQGFETRWRQFCHFKTEYTKDFENCVPKSPIVSPIVLGN